MARFEQRFITIGRWEWFVPSGPIVELNKAESVALHKYKELYGNDPAHDDWLLIEPHDEGVTLYFEVRG